MPSAAVSAADAKVQVLSTGACVRPDNPCQRVGDGVTRAGSVVREAGQQSAAVRDELTALARKRLAPFRSRAAYGSSMRYRALPPARSVASSYGTGHGEPAGHRDRAGRPSHGDLSRARLDERTIRPRAPEGRLWWSASAGLTADAGGAVEPQASVVDSWLVADGAVLGLTSAVVALADETGRVIALGPASRAAEWQAALAALATGLTSRDVPAPRCPDNLPGPL
jgi:hypothetical protein